MQNLQTGETSLEFQYSSGGGFMITGGTIGVPLTLLNINDDGVHAFIDYATAGGAFLRNTHGPLTISSSATWFLDAQGAGSTSRLSGDVMQIATAGLGTRMWFDMINDPGKIDVYPNSANGGKLGTAGNIWAELHATAVFPGAAKITSGAAATPNGSVVGSPGDLFLSTNGGAGTTLWVKESGAATNTGWVGK